MALAGLAPTPLAGQTPPGNLLTGRCALDLPLDAGQGFDHQRFLVLNDKTYLFDQAWQNPAIQWRLASRTVDTSPGTAAGPFRTRKKWRDGALWLQAGRKLFKREPKEGRWVLKAEPALEFMDFEVDMTGRILLVCTADPATRLYRALLEILDDNGRSTTILAPYPDPGCLDWGRKVSPVAAATLQVGYESVQILEFTLLYNPLARRLFIFRPLEDRLQEVNLGLPRRTYQDLLAPAPLEDLCWQVLPKDTTEAWVVMRQPEGTLAAFPLDLFEGTAGDPRPLPGLALPVFPDPSGRLVGLEEALQAFTHTLKASAGTSPLPPSRD
jgi:hypothetical protein